MIQAGTNQFRPRHRNPRGRLSAGSTLGATHRYRRPVAFDALPTRLMARPARGGPRARVSVLPRSGVGQAAQIIGAVGGVVMAGVNTWLQLDAQHRERIQERHDVEREAAARAEAERLAQERAVAEAQAAVVPVAAGSAPPTAPPPTERRPVSALGGAGGMLALGVGVLALLARR